MTTVSSPSSAGDLLTRLAAIVGAAHVLSAPEDMAGALTDWRGRYTGAALAVVRPAATEEVAAIVRLCTAEGVVIVPQGGNTGMCAAATPLPLAVHVVGSFTPEHWRAAMPAGAPDPDTLPLRFHGRLETSALRAFYREVDVVVSPNRPRVLHAGNFDGFPTGCCVEGALCGVVMVASDPLGLNAGRYREGVEFVRIEPDGADVARALRTLLADPPSVKRIGEAGQAVTRRLFAPDVQIGGRIAVLERALRAAH